MRKKTKNKFPTDGRKSFRFVGSKKRKHQVQSAYSEEFVTVFFLFRLSNLASSDAVIIDLLRQDDDDWSRRRLWEGKRYRFFDTWRSILQFELLSKLW